MEEELQKRNTDCVYFLASPLTCKKGSECEYRHSEMARLNPRDCWYWLSGSCLNPSCAFRHPPLDAGHTETSDTAPNTPAVSVNKTNVPAVSVNKTNVPAVSVNKTNVPCYYFYNGFCNKGDLCTFLHGPITINNVHPQKPSNARANPDGPAVEKKGSVGSDTGSAPRVMLSKSFQTGHQQTTRRPIMRKEPDLEIYQPSPTKAANESASLTTSRSPYEDAAADSSISPVEATGSVPRSPHASSPGFDVLVDNGSDELVYEDDYNYVVDHNGDSGEPVGDEYENARDDPQYADSSIFYEKERRDHGYHFGTEHSLDRVREGPPDSRRSVLDRVVLARRHSPREHAYNGQHSVDLRDRIKRRRMTDDHSHNAYSGMRESSRHISRSRDRPRYEAEHHLRRSMEVDNFGSRIVHEGRFTRPSFDRSRLQEKPQLSSKDSGNATVRKRSYDEESTVFKGPKSLAQIKDEKKRTRGSREPSEGALDGFLEDNFVAPKTLGEILEEKRRLGSLVNGNTNSN